MITAALSLLTLGSLFLVAPPDQPDAKQLLERAAEAQHAAAFAGKVKDFRVRLKLQVNDSERGRLDFDVERKFQAPDRLWTRVEEKFLSGAKYQEGFDGKVAWRYDERKQDLTLFEGPDYRVDRKKIQGELDDMRRLLEFLFLEDLTDEVTDLKRLPDLDSENDEMDSFIVTATGDLGEEEGGKVAIKVWIQKGTFQLLGARIDYLEQPGRSLHFCFWSHHETPQGVVVPGKITIYRDKKEDEDKPFTEEIYLATVGGEHEQDLNDITFNNGFDDRDFRPPEK